MKKKKQGFIPKKNKNKPKKSESKNHASLVMDVIVSLGKDASLKKLFPILLKSFTQEEIILAINKLDHEGKIHIGNRGVIKLSGGKAEGSRGNSRGKGDSVTGTIDLAQSGAGYVTVEGYDRDIFVAPNNVKDALQGDTVRLFIRYFKGRPEGEVVEILKRSQDSFVGRLDVLEKFAFFIADEKKLKTDVFIPLHSLKGAVHKDRVIIRITNWNKGGKNPVGEVLEILKPGTSSDLDMKTILIENGFSIDFPREVYMDLDLVSEKISAKEIEGRMDLRGVTTFTIDPEDARDFDDALSVRQLENRHYEIGVHIADVSHYVIEGSPLDIEAERRATSVYLPDRVCPMLPEKLSNVLCSLRPHEDKLTFSALFVFDEHYRIQSYKLGKSVIHSNRRFTYEEAQQVLETGNGDFVEELQLLHRISKNIRSARMKNGAIAFEKSEVRFKLDETGKPLGIVLKERKDAHLLVEDFMLLANETVAKYGGMLRGAKKQKPFVYRIHDAPDAAKLEQFSLAAARFGYQLSFENPKQVSETLNALLKKVEGKPEQNVLETMAIRSMAKAAYTTQNIGHYGLAMEHYTHFTSPIRRYPDVLVHRLLQAMLFKSDVIIDREELEIRCKHSSEMERKAMSAEREATKYKQIEFLQDKVGEVFEGVITGVIQRGIFVEINSNKCEGMVSLEMLGDEDFKFEEKLLLLTGMRTRRKFEMGMPVQVQVVSADIALRRIDLRLV